MTSRDLEAIQKVRCTTSEVGPYADQIARIEQEPFLEKNPSQNQGKE